MVDRIRLTGAGSALEIPCDHVYFAFASGRWRYNCSLCGAQCCRGHGYIATEDEVRHQLCVRPHVRFFVEPVRGRSAVRQVTNCPPACFFLRADGLCEIHDASGFDRKPETCRHFPFNHFYLLGKHLVVAPHPSLCPLEMVAVDEAPEQTSAHDVLLSLLQAGGVAAPIQHTPYDDSEPLFAYETCIRDLSERQLKQRGRLLPFLDELVVQAASSAEASRKGQGVVPSTSALGLAARSAQVLGTETHELLASDPAFEQMFAAMIPILRSEMIVQARGNAAKCQPMLLSRMLIGAYIMARLARLAGTQMTFQAIRRTFCDHVPLISVLAHLDVPMRWRHDLAIDLVLDESDRKFQQAMIGVGRSLLAKREACTPRDLGEVITACNGWDGSNRVRFLKLVSQRLYGHVVPLGTRDKSVAVWPSKRARYAVQRVMLGTLPEGVIQRVYERAVRSW